MTIDLTTDGGLAMLAWTEIDDHRRRRHRRSYRRASDSQDRWPTGGPIETITYDLKKLTSEKIRWFRAILVEAVVAEADKG